MVLRRLQRAGPLSAPAATEAGLGGREGGRRTFACVSGPSVPAETLELLGGACAARAVSFREVRCDHDGPPTDPVLAPGDMLYRAGMSHRALEVERLLYRPDLATFHSGPEGPHRPSSASLAPLAKAGLPTPAIAEHVTADRDELRDHVQRLGGLPVVVKVMGGSRGIGVMIVDTMRGLYSLVDYLDSLGTAMTLIEFVERAVHWRVIVVGVRAVAAYRNLREEGDFRTYASPDRADYLDHVPGELARVAVRSLALLHFETGGVDILEDAGGRLHLLECNFPCYFAGPERVAGIDVAGPMLDHLLSKICRSGDRN